MVQKRKRKIGLATNNQPGNAEFRKKLKLLEVIFTGTFIEGSQSKDQEETKSK